MKTCALVNGSCPLAEMEWNEIASRLGISSSLARKTYSRAIKKLRARPVQLGLLHDMAAELEKKRPVAVDWFGSEDGDEERTA